MRRWQIIAVLAVLAAAFLWQHLVIRGQAEQIDEMCREVSELRERQLFWPSLIRAEIARLELHIKEWIDGAKNER